MMDEKELREKTQKIEALFARAGTEGKRLAAEEALERIKRRLQSTFQNEKPAEMKFYMQNRWSHRLFVALCRRYSLKPYRYVGQQYTTVMIMVPRSFLDNVLWPEFIELDNVLESYLDSITDRVIHEEVFCHTEDVEEIPEPLQLPS
ncbi:MAG: hypothetical protein ACE15F_16490 [bacterium]